MNTLLAILLLIPTLSEDLSQLNAELKHAPEYDARHEQYIDSLRSSVQLGDSCFETYLALFEAYASYQFDSAYYYVQCLERVARSDDPDQIAVARIKKAFALFSAGLFKDSHEILSQLDHIDRCSPEVQSLYYGTFARLCMDMGTYSDGIFYDKYTQSGIRYLTRQLELLSPSDTLTYNYARAMRAMKREQYRQSLMYFNCALQSSHITSHERAIVYSTMAYPAHMLGEHDASMHYTIQAAICDLRGSIKETVALRFVAANLHELGRCDEAMHYITKARDDAEFYGARHRQMDVIQILPIIEHEQYRLERRLHFVTIGILVFVILGMIILACLIYYLRRKLVALGDAHEQIEQMNRQLTELGKIKEEYIGNYLIGQSELIRTMDTMHSHLLHMCREGDRKALVNYIQSIPRQNRRHQFTNQFDRMYLKICPDFIEDFNAQLQPQYRVTPKEGELLTTEMRIFALINLGVTSNEMIAQVLDYSVHTIYTYKNRIRNHKL